MRWTVDRKTSDLVYVSNASDSANKSDAFDNTTITSSTFFGSSEDVAIRIIYIAFLAVGLVSNCVLLAFLTKSQRRTQAKSFNLFIISLAAANIILCAANFPLFIGSAVKPHWGYDGVVCNLDAMVVYTISVAIQFVLLYMTVDNTISIKTSVGMNCMTMTSFRARVLIGYAWLHALALAIPAMLSDFVSIRGLYLCYVWQGSPPAYIWLLATLGYLVPALVNIILSIELACSAVCPDRNYRQAALASAIKAESSSTQSWIEIQGASKYSSLLFIFWCIFQGPFVTKTFVNALEVKEIPSPFDHGYRHHLDAAFTWLFITYPLVLPILTLGWKNDIWVRTKRCLLCRHSDQFVAVSPHSTPARLGCPSTTAGAPGGDRFITRDGVCNVPVLFATENGLHVRTYSGRNFDHRRQVPLPEKYPLGADVVSAADGEKFGDPTLISETKQCDIFGSIYSQSRSLGTVSPLGDHDCESHGDGDSVFAMVADVATSHGSVRSNDHSDSRNDHIGPVSKYKSTAETNQQINRSDKHFSGSYVAQQTFNDQTNGRHHKPTQPDAGLTESQVREQQKSSKPTRHPSDIGKRIPTSSELVHTKSTKRKPGENKKGKQNSVGVLEQSRSQFFDHPNNDNFQEPPPLAESPLNESQVQGKTKKKLILVSPQAPQVQSTRRNVFCVSDEILDLSMLSTKISDTAASFQETCIDKPSRKPASNEGRNNDNVDFKREKIGNLIESQNSNQLVRTGNESNGSGNEPRCSDHRLTITSNAAQTTKEKEHSNESKTKTKVTAAKKKIRTRVNSTDSQDDLLLNTSNTSSELRYASSTSQLNTTQPDQTAASSQLPNQTLASNTNLDDNRNDVRNEIHSGTAIHLPRQDDVRGDTNNNKNDVGGSTRDIDYFRT